MCKWYTGNYPGWNFAHYVLEIMHSDNVALKSR